MPDAEIPRSKPAASAPATPRENGLLAALPRQDYERLLPDLEPVALPSGWTVYAAGERAGYLYLPTAGIVSQFHLTRDGASAEFALTGNEGVIGVESFLGGESSPTHAMVLDAGHAFRLKAQPLRDKFEQVGPLQELLLRYTQALIAQAGQVAACNRHHSLEQRACRWMLGCLDRSRSNALTMTHRMIATLLGVRRESVTGTIRALRRAEVIHCRRGHIAVLDRPRLEARACECYAVVRREYERLLPGHRHAQVAS